MTTQATAPAKKRVRRSKARRAVPLENKSRAQKALSIGAMSAWVAGRTLFSVARMVIGTVLVIAAAVAAASLVPKPVQRQIAGNVRDTALLAANRVKSLAA